MTFSRFSSAAWEDILKFTLCKNTEKVANVWPISESLYDYIAMQISKHVISGSLSSVSVSKSCKNRPCRNIVSMSSLSFVHSLPSGKASGLEVFMVALPNLLQKSHEKTTTAIWNSNKLLRSLVVCKGWSWVLLSPLPSHRPHPGQRSEVYEPAWHLMSLFLPASLLVSLILKPGISKSQIAMIKWPSQEEERLLYKWGRYHLPQFPKSLLPWCL